MPTFNTSRSLGGRKGRLLVALLVAVVSLVAYYGKRQDNPVTGEIQHVDLSTDQEVALGLQAAPEMAAQHGGLHADSEAQALVDRVGQRLVAGSVAQQSPYPFEFHLLADEQTVNAFALPGGQVFITAGLLAQLRTEGEVAGVLGHEIGHVVGRHGAEHIAKQQLAQGLTGAAVLATYDPDNPASRNSAAIAALIANLVTMRFGREDELESDRLGVRFLGESGYDPRALVGVMEVLHAASAGGTRPPEFFSTHPDPERRVEEIQAAIAAQFPNGVPSGVTP
jgi:predicted Zn-dependent protease